MREQLGTSHNYPVRISGELTGLFGKKGQWVEADRVLEAAVTALEDQRSEPSGDERNERPVPKDKDQSGPGRSMRWRVKTVRHSESSANASHDFIGILKEMKRYDLF